MGFPEFGDGRAQVVPLALEVGDLRRHLIAVEADHEIGGIVLRRGRGARRDEIMDLGEREAEALALEDQLEANAIVRRIIPCGALPTREDQSLVLVEARRLTP